MNSARIDKSPRLQRVLGLLYGGKWHSTMDIIQSAKVCAVNSIVSELRDNGYKIDCKRNGDKWLYRLEV